MEMKITNIIDIQNADRRLVMSAPEGAGPQLFYWGPVDGFSQALRLPDAPLPSSPDQRKSRLLFPTLGAGFFGEPAILFHRERKSDLNIQLIDTAATKHSATLKYEDSSLSLSFELHFEMLSSGCLRTWTRVTNTGDTPVSLHRMNALSMPLPRWACEVDLTFGGWSLEGQSARIPLVAGKIERTGRAGRPGFDGGPHLILTEAETNEHHGNAIGVALAYSGDFTIAAERLGDGEAQIIAAEWLQPGEIILSTGQSYTSPNALSAISTVGLNGLSAQFHRFARAHAPQTRVNRPVQLNSWEAAYFGADEQTAMRLAHEAAAIGAERFVLDDGWFLRRDNDRAGLGDWTPDPRKFPHGLKPLSDYVCALGLEFGLWVEPEMVNEDSELFRAHPDWILTSDGRVGPTGRNQLVLDLSRSDVRDYLYTSLKNILSAANITYLKWDCNRDLYPAATPGGPATHKQIAGLYALLNKIRNDFPSIAIESCASGGGRMDYGVLQFADRFWASDATDALERVRIQRRASIFYPIELLGAHVGSSPNHLTKRHWPMAFRCLSAFFAHFGVEVDPATLNQYDKDVLKRAIALYKEYRSMLMQGEFLRMATDDAAVDVQVAMNREQTKALVRVLRLAEPLRPTRAPVRIIGLPDKSFWRVTELTIAGAEAPGPLGEYSSASLAFVGLDVNPAHTAEGALFLLETVL